MNRQSNFRECAAMFAIGLDIGYSNLKLAFGKVSDDGLAKPAVTRVLPAGAGRLSDLPLRMGKADGDTDALVVNVNGEKWAAGVDQARLETSVRELHADYPASDAYRALFHAALLMGEHDTVDQLITGLPVSQFLDKDLRARLSDRLTGQHQVTAGRAITVKNTLVVPQPFGAYLDLLNTVEDAAELEESRIMVIDPGFFSVDWIAIEEGEIRKASSGTSKRAMSVLIETVNSLIQEDHGGSAGIERLEQAVRQGKTSVPVFGTPVELAPYMDKAAQRVAVEALKEMKQQLRANDRAVDVVLIVGGGAKAYEAAARDLFPKSRPVLPQEPVLANARGFWSAAVQ